MYTWATVVTGRDGDLDQIRHCSIVEGFDKTRGAQRLQREAGSVGESAQKRRRGVRNGGKQRVKRAADAGGEEPWLVGQKTVGAALRHTFGDRRSRRGNKTIKPIDTAPVWGDKFSLLLGFKLSNHFFLNSLSFHIPIIRNLTHQQSTTMTSSLDQLKAAGTVRFDPAPSHHVRILTMNNRPLSATPVTSTVWSPAPLFHTKSLTCHSH